MISLGILAEDEVFRQEENLQWLNKYFQINDFSNWKSFDATTLINKCRSVEVILIARRSPIFPLELADDPGRLKYVCHLHGTIRPYIDKKLVEKGLLVSNWGESVDGVAEGAMALLLCQLKQLMTLNAFAKGGQDDRIYQMFPCTLKNRDVGLYGFGPIGRHMARMLEPFQPRIAIYDPYANDIPPQIRRCGSLRELFSTCQIISIHCGLNRETENSVTKELLDLLPQGGIVINTARGGIVDEHALADSVKRGRLLAGVDVIQNERHWNSSPLAPLDGAVMTKHILGKGKGYPPGCAPKPQLPDFALENLKAYAEGKPLKNLITAEIYDLKT